LYTDSSEVRNFASISKALENESNCIHLVHLCSEAKMFFKILAFPLTATYPNRLDYIALFTTLFKNLLYSKIENQSSYFLLLPLLVTMVVLPP
jgi:hypothetical protein